MFGFAPSTWKWSQENRATICGCGKGTVEGERGCTQGGGKKGRKRKGRPRLRWKCAERFGRSGREGRTRARDGGGGQDGWWRRQLNGISDEEEGKQKSTNGIGANLTSDLVDKEESNNKYVLKIHKYVKKYVLKVYIINNSIYKWDIK